MFYIYEGSVDPKRDIYVLRGLLGLLAWCGGSRRILCTFPLFLSFLFFFFHQFSIFISYRSSASSGRDSSEFSKERKKNEESLSKRRYASLSHSRFDRVYLCVSERACIL
ncbi:unnamed protein product [Lasius platythorax]|uniref:Transmembrane protein n=1 Tax=Lasius platythorax TaxID=488582 RepID=A0AAV2N2N2_9HYME